MLDVKSCEQRKPKELIVHLFIDRAVKPVVIRGEWYRDESRTGE